MTVELPNIRKLFIPDPGHEIADCDLSGADAQVVAWEADDAELKAAFRAGLKVHKLNAQLMFPDKVKGWTDDDFKATDHPGGLYYSCKRGVHGTNYGASARTVAQACGWTVHEAEEFQRRWFGARPGIKLWHRRTERQLITSKSVTNAFGFTRTYFARTDGLLPEALAWVPQSTVGLVCSLAMQNIYERAPWVELLVQVHDSLVFQYLTHMRSRLAELKKLMTITIPYPDPLIIPWGLSTSTVSWGACKSISWPQVPEVQEKLPLVSGIQVPVINGVS